MSVLKLHLKISEKVINNTWWVVLHHKIFLLVSNKRGLRLKLTVDSYISKTKRLLKSIVEHKLLRIMLVILCTFIVYWNGPIRKIWARSLKHYFSIYLNKRYWNSENLLKKQSMKSQDLWLMPRKRGWPLKLRVKKGLKSS